MASSASSRVGPLYHTMFSDFWIMLSPWKPEMGTKLTCTPQRHHVSAVTATTSCMQLSGTWAHGR